MGAALTARRRLVQILLASAVAGLAVAGLSFAWRAIGGGPLGLHGLIAISLGVSGTISLAWFLMALAFRSSREGWDARAGERDKS